LPLISTDITHGPNRTRRPELEQCATDSCTFPAGECWGRCSHDPAR